MPRAPPSWRPSRPPRTRSVRLGIYAGANQSKSPGTWWFRPGAGALSFADLFLAGRRSQGAYAPEETLRVDSQSNTGRDRYDQCFSHHPCESFPAGRRHSAQSQRRRTTRPASGSAAESSACSPAAFRTSPTSLGLVAERLNASSRSGLTAHLGRTGSPGPSEDIVLTPGRGLWPRHRPRPFPAGALHVNHHQKRQHHH